MRVIRALATYLTEIRWDLPWTTGPRGGGPMLDEALDRARREGAQRHIAQEDTGHGRRRDALARCMPEPPRSIP